jgi:transposase
MDKGKREDIILDYISKLEKSSLSPKTFIDNYGAPFSIAQYYRYRAKLLKKGKNGLRDSRQEGNNRKLRKDEIVFLKGYIKNKPDVSPSEVMRIIAEEFGTNVHRSTMSRALRKLGFVFKQRAYNVLNEHVSCAGFELIAALAIHLGWSSHTAQVIFEVINSFSSEPNLNFSTDKQGRNEKGQFTKRYNQAPDVRKMRFASIEIKRAKKDHRLMDIFGTSLKSLEQKSLALLALPLVTLNGKVRHVNTAFGNALKGFCGYNYKQSTLDRFLRELKYLGLSESLLCGQIRFWHDNWKRSESELPFLCYYIDGNTKPIWSKYRVQKSKVTMLGRVMGCLEQVFLHDSFGCPIYFETYSGHGQMGVYTLSMMKKIEQYLEGETPGAHVTRVLVMDSASNSVETLRAFASQDSYHYITTLDDNQWSNRKIHREGSIERYRWGAATLYDYEVELEDSKEKGYLIVVRAVRIEWDYGKKTVLLTSLPFNVIGSSLVVKGYFDRWPKQELTFRSMKKFVSLHHVAGYGKQLQEDQNVIEKQKELQDKIQDIKNILKDSISEISIETEKLTLLIEQERILRYRSDIKDGKRLLSQEDEELLKACTRKIGRVHRRIKSIEAEHKKDFVKLHNYETNWLNLQGKESVYKADVELDKILTYFRVSLANVCAYFLKEILKIGPLSVDTLMQSVLLLDGIIEETNDVRKVMIKRNQKDPEMMDKLGVAFEKLNELSMCTLSGKYYHFSFS